MMANEIMCKNVKAIQGDMKYICICHYKLTGCLKGHAKPKGEGPSVIRGATIPPYRIGATRRYSMANSLWAPHNPISNTAVCTDPKLPTGGITFCLGLYSLKFYILKKKKCSESVKRESIVM